MNRYMAIILVAFLAAFGCVASDSARQARVLDPKPEEQQLVEEYIAKGLSFEKQMSYTSALEQYELALAIDPENKTAARHKETVRQTLFKRAQDYYRQGLLLDEQGKYSAAREAYLKALQNWPDHIEAREKLLPEGIDDANIPYITHTLTYGESVSKLGLIYYGDLKTYPVIGKFNNLEDVTRVQVGKELKIPVIPSTNLYELQQRQADYIASRNAEKAGMENCLKLSLNRLQQLLKTILPIFPHRNRLQRKRLYRKYPKLKCPQQILRVPIFPSPRPGNRFNNIH